MPNKKDLVAVATVAAGVMLAGLAMYHLSNFGPVAQARSGFGA